MQKVLLLMKSTLYFFLAFILASYLRSCCLIQGRKDINPCFFLFYYSYSFYIYVFDPLWVNFCIWCEIGIRNSFWAPTLCQTLLLGESSNKGDMSCYSVQFSHSVMSDSLRPHGLQHARLPCPSPSPGVCSGVVMWVSDAIQPSHPVEVAEFIFSWNALQSLCPLSPESVALSDF